MGCTPRSYLISFKFHFYACTVNAKYGLPSESWFSRVGNEGLITLRGVASNIRKGYTCILFNQITFIRESLSLIKSFVDNALLYGTSALPGLSDYETLLTLTTRFRFHFMGVNTTLRSLADVENGAIWIGVWTPYRIVCNGGLQKSLEARTGVTLTHSRFMPLHTIRYGIGVCVHIVGFGGCKVRCRHHFTSSVFDCP